MATALDKLKAHFSKGSTAGKIRDRNKQVDEQTDAATDDDGYESYKSTAEEAGERVISRDEYRRKYAKKK
jgi:hypothetical protein